MQPRAAVWELIVNDPVLQSDFGIDPNRVRANYSIDDLGDLREGYFLVLRWEESTVRSGTRQVSVLTVWAHRSQHESRDFHPLSSILERVEEVLTSSYQVTGSDGITMSQARCTGQGGDFLDGGYDTICRNAAFEVNSKVG